MKSLFLLATLGSCLLATGPTLAQGPTRKEMADAEERRPLTEAPFVFLGRFLTSEFYQDKSGHYYKAQVWQVMHVLRGGKQIEVGTIRMNEESAWHQGKPLVPPTLGRPKFLPPQTKDEWYKWSIMFCRPSDLPESPVPYKTTNRRTLRFYSSNSYIARTIWVIQTSDGPDPIPSSGVMYEGVGVRFDSEEALNGYLRTVPNLEPIPQPVDAYPKLKFVDARAAYLPVAPEKPLLPEEPDVNGGEW